MNETTMTLAGNLVADPELRYTPQGTPVATFRVASTARYKGPEGWKDGDTLFLTVCAWRDLGEHVTETCHKGDRVIVTGRVRQRTYTPNDTNTKVTVTELDAYDVGVSLQRVTAQLTKTTKRTNGESDNGGAGYGGEPPF